MRVLAQLILSNRNSAVPRQTIAYVSLIVSVSGIRGLVQMVALVARCV